VAGRPIRSLSRQTPCGEARFPRLARESAYHPGVTRPTVPTPPAKVLLAAERRADARATRDWATADELRAEIEAAGWRVTDAGTEFRLEPAHPADEELEGEIRYGRSDAVPTLLEQAPTQVATIVLAVEAGDPATVDAVSAAARHLPLEAALVVVGDGIDDDTAAAIRAALEAAARDDGHEDPHELVRTTAALGRAAALNAGIRRASGATVILLDSSIQPTGDVATPLSEALADPEAAIVGPFGLATTDLRRFEEVVAVGDGPEDVAAIEGYCMAFRRADFQERGPLDEAFRFYRNLDIWWSLALRDDGEGRAPRRALAIPKLPVARERPWSWTSTPARERERLSKRNFYRVLDRYRTRLDLAVSPPTG
jgi:hypothetical protein